MAEIIELANENQVLFFEAARNIHEKSFDTIASVLTEHGNIIGANFTYMKYSSRYDAVLAGEEPNIFLPIFWRRIGRSGCLSRLCSTSLVWRDHKMFIILPGKS